MIYLVIAEKLTPEGKKNFKKVQEWQGRVDEWLVSHGATWKSVKHFSTLIGEPLFETWIGYPNYSAMDRDEKKARNFVNDPEWQDLISQMNIFFQRVNSKVMKEI
jgi:hypothetical protein